MSLPTLFIYDEQRVLKKVKAFDDYHSAVLVGQELVGYGNFFVDYGARTPTREEQLLLPPIELAPKRVSSRKLRHERLAQAD